MRVLQISKYYYPFLGGTEQVARDIANVLKTNDIEQKIICFNANASDGTYTCKSNETIEEKVEGVDVIRCGCQLKISSQSLSLSYGNELKKCFNEFKPDVVIFHYPNPFVAHYLLKYIPDNTKLYVYWHLDITKQKILKKFFNNQNIRLIKRANKIIGATPIHLNESFYSKEFRDKKYLLPYAIDEKNIQISVGEIEEAKKLKEKYKGKTLAFFIGRHVPYKGLRYLIEASSIIKDNNIHFFIAGKGELTEELKELAKNDLKVEFLGRITDSQRRIYLYACDIFCFPSITRNEAFGLALAEAMYFGKPAITFTIPGSGVNYVSLDKITGIECPNRDSEAYAQALILLSNDEKLRNKYGKAARKRILDNFVTNKFEENIIKLIKI